MKSIDTNVLVYAHREDSEHFQTARDIIEDLIKSKNNWAIAWPSIYEFHKVVTSKHIFNNPSPVKIAVEFVEKLFNCNNLKLLGHSNAHTEHYLHLVKNLKAKSNFIFDIQIASILLENGITEIITNDDDFLKFKDLKVTNPF